MYLPSMTFVSLLTADIILRSDYEDNYQGTETPNDDAQDEVVADDNDEAETQETDPPSDTWYCENGHLNYEVTTPKGTQCPACLADG
jgi:hypothetical protein